MRDLSPPLRYSEQVEIFPTDEPEDIRKALAMLEQSFVRNEQANGRRMRAVHAKAHGYATAEFRVLPNLPSELAQGLFAQENTYEAVVRFSNASDRPQPDFLPDGRGLAIKLFHVEGERLETDEQGAATQDFVLVNHPVFFAKDVKDFLRFEQVLAAPADERLLAAGKAFTGGSWNPLDWHWQNAFQAAEIAGHLPRHPASYTYYSMAPFRLGDYVAKFRIRPACEIDQPMTEVARALATDPDALRQLLEATLSTQHLLFELQVQLRTSDETMPIEDATVQWPESQSPYRAVGLLLLPRQTIASEGERAVGEQLAFNVWHALAAHRPLGGINRLRREAYRRSAAWRREAFGRKPVDEAGRPTADEATSSS